MRLKFLFFPLTLIVSVFIFIGYVWPEIMNLKIANEENLKKNEELKVIEDKKDAIKRINDQIDGNTEGELLVKGYLPVNRIEEKIMTDINFLATDSSVSLINISLEDKQTKEDEAATMALSSAMLSNATGVNDKPVEIKKEGLQFTTASILFAGKYENIRIFIDQLQTMTVFNSIQSVNITKGELKKSGLMAEGEVVSNDAEPSLSAEVVINFGWMNPIAINSKNISNFKSGMDNDTVSILTNYVSKKTPSTDTFGDKNGKSNPFNK
ncbi:MAG: hypothetical protein ACD_5C00037G0007 [uncultured bacterium]|nr:MAG: hypothetical protein ACD_5C00037G0007 [uncultured bacterium]